jgi:hypothetical protein
MRTIVLVVLLGVGVGGCVSRHGPDADEVARTLNARGHTVRVQLQSFENTPRREFTGELIEVRDSALLILTDELLLASFVGVRRIDIHGPMPKVPRSAREDYMLRRPGTHLRPISRFPFGAPTPALDHILRQHSQSEPRRVTP